MTPITETDDLYPETIPQLELTDPVLGGPSGPSNAAAIALANRTRYLKAALEALGPGGAGSAENIGTGTGLYLGTEAGVLQFLSLLEGTGVTLTPLPTGLRIDVTGGGEGGVSGTSARIKVVTTDFGAIGDGTTADRAAFEAAHAGTDPDWPIVVPSGNYNLGGTDLVTNGRRWILEGTTTFTAGKLRQCMFERHNPMGTVDVWYDRAATMFEQRTPFRLGGQSITPALSIGSADPDQSPFGSVLYADGHSNFLALKPEEPFNPMEINLYSYAYSGRANGVAGTNRILRNITSCPASMPWTPEMVGKCLYFGGVRYKVLSRVSDGEITVAAWPSTPVSFTSTAEATYHFTYTMFRGRCSTSGTAVTWKSGHKFFGYLESWNPSSMIVINGVSYTVSSVTDMEHLVLTASAGTQADVAFVGYAEVDGETTALRLNHAITGEQLTFMTSAGALDGKGPAFLIKTDKGVGSWNPIVMQNGGQDGLTVAYNAPAGKAFVGIGNRRNPVCELDVDGAIKNTHLTLRENALERHDDDADGSVIAINYYGYLGGATRYRDLEIYDGKGNLVARFDGANRVVDFVNPPTVNGVPMSEGGIDPDMLDVKPTYVDIGGQGTAKALRVYQGTVGGGGNWLEIDGVPSGDFPSLSTRGGDPDITLIIDSQGAGGVRFTAGSRSYRAFEVLAPAGSLTWPYVSSHATAAEFGVLGPAAAYDLNLVPKGTTGRVLVKGAPLQGIVRLDANKTTDVFTLTSAALQAVKFSLVNTNVGAIGTWSTATQRFTFAYAGTYRITANVMYDCNSAGSIIGFLFVRKNDSNADANSIKGTVGNPYNFVAGQRTGGLVTGVLTVAAGDFVSLYSYLSVTGSWTTTAEAQALTSMSIERIA